ncbi:betaine/proline/choline family ABC transporter ATP-binding protein [Halothermothrix orenii]|uniref:Quaternary amine transport ATP-binding protein n=1 Tax=Halothermothrix orenii (strain H 168 / OCM 544 / DSM 9562) TaxID=373903 RepID=B8CZ74_HALOH|nr:ABC transporter ATP-binding protein [Halothermothrix orenii]ACL70593.1 glycine betaine/L-proline ABC transporter, ATPase subunit [Halothermothrix orenii H 168]
MIRLEGISKVYPNMDRPAVKELNLHIEEGEICILVGPSGCGKTTTLKIINRLIEPSSGKIYINGKDAMKEDPNELRQNIGYVIQQIGLFPHMTVYENIATVPRLRDWDEGRIRKRVDELLEMVELDPEENRYKYPMELSGGQRQRVGVARAMAIDPPIMLMDEPFGAVDPITRTQLQNEFLKLQRKIKKTIVFVTHDIDEAIKMGDKIAIMNQGELVQFDTPANILFNPGNEFVEDFVGSDRGLKVLNLIHVDKIMNTGVPTVESVSRAEDVLKEINNLDQDYIMVTGEDEHLAGYISSNRLKKHQDSDWYKFLKPTPVVEIEATLKDALAKMIENDVAVVPVVNDERELVGTVTLKDIRSYVSNSYQENDLVSVNI